MDIFALSDFNFGGAYTFHPEEILARKDLCHVFTRTSHSIFPTPKDDTSRFGWCRTDGRRLY
jgi:hypothetical protein